MPRLSLIRAVLAGILALGAVLGAALAPSAAAPADGTDPLLVHIDTITPVLPGSGSVEITGTVTNASDETFTRINLHPFSSPTPILDAARLAESAAIDPTEFVGPRVTVPGTFATVDQLAPGESASFADSVPVELLDIPDEDGVYWIGIHAIGDSESTPRDEVADGRARTFIPTRPRGDRSAEASVVLPIRNRVWYDDEGRIAGTDRWARRLADGGSLDGILDMADSAGTAPYTWLVDPAVLMAVARLSVGNPPRTLDPDPTVPGQEPTPTEPTTDPTEVPQSLSPSGGPAPTDDEQVLAATAAAWLTRFKATVGSASVLTLPFGDLDVSSAVRNSPERLTEATARSVQVMSDLELGSLPAVSPTDDVLSADALTALPEDTVVMLGDNAFAIPPTTKNSVVKLLGHKVVVTSTGAESGGPGPTASNDPLALRQRLISEAALRADNRDTAPLVVTLPTVWRGEDAAVFFDDLEQSWLDLVPVTSIAERSATGVPARTLTYTDTDQEAELPAVNFLTADRTSAAATLTEAVLALQTSIEAQVRDEVLVTLSEQHRTAPRLASLAAGRVEDSLRAELRKIKIEGPTSVTLSSDSGKLGATLVNGLDQPVTVQVAALTDGDLTLTGDTLRTLGPKARSVVRYEARTSQPGVHNVVLAVTSVDGVRLGSVDELPIRAARVSALIWFVMGAGALVLFGMIGYRLPGQIRARRRELATAERGEGHPGPIGTDASTTTSTSATPGLVPERP